MIVVTVQLSKRAQGDPATMARVRQPLALAIALARRVKERVALQGRTATPVPGYDTGSTKSRGGDRRWRVSKAYADALGVEQHWRSSAQFHSAIGTRAGTFRATGGMWQGLVARNVGSAAATVDFQGSSVGGYDPSARQLASEKRGRARKAAQRRAAAEAAGRQPTKRKPRDPSAPPSQPRERVASAARNSVKAGSIWVAQKVNVVQPTAAEEQAMNGALVAWTSQRMQRLLGAELAAIRVGGDRAMYREAVALLRDF